MDRKGNHLLITFLQDVCFDCVPASTYFYMYLFPQNREDTKKKNAFYDKLKKLCCLVLQISILQPYVYE